MNTPETPVESLDVPPVPLIVILPPLALMADEMDTPLPAPCVVPVIVTLPVPPASRLMLGGSEIAGPGPGLSAVSVMLPVPVVVMLFGAEPEPPVLFTVTSPWLLMPIDPSVNGALLASRMLQ